MSRLVGLIDRQLPHRLEQFRIRLLDRIHYVTWTRCPDRLGHADLAHVQRAESLVQPPLTIGLGSHANHSGVIRSGSSRSRHS